MTKMFVGGIPYSITTQQLEELFKQYGQVASVNIITDKFSGQSKGFAFVEMNDDNEAQEAIKQLNGYALEGRSIGVSVAKPREDRPSNGGFNRNNDGFQRNNRNGGFDRDNNRRGR